MEEFEVTYEGMTFEVVAQYEPEQQGDYDTEYIPHTMYIHGVYVGDNCIDFMHNERTIKKL